MSNKKNTISMFTDKEMEETCEICGKVIDDDDVHNWMLDCYFVPTPQPPRYEDDVLALCRTCCEAVAKKWRAEEARHQPKYRSIDDPWSPS